MRIPLVYVLAALLCLSCVSRMSLARTVVDDHFQQRIPAEGITPGLMDPVTLFVPYHQTITDVDVHLQITHSAVCDLMIYLDAPWGQTVTLKDDEMMVELWPPGSQTANMLGTIFDDEADIRQFQGQPPYTGRFLPALGQSLSLLDGYDAYGYWTLRIDDIAEADIGTLDYLALDFEFTHTPEPTSLSICFFASLFAVRRKKNHINRNV
ncbi:MAG: proprotein convertase P-domain-containing protein [Sedimentisphaerales bacterium]|nr:proprotein convertase P-domain-containing protein [Sedimentisphaerales bacterium]